MCAMVAVQEKTATFAYNAITRNTNVILYT